MNAAGGGWLDLVIEPMGPEDLEAVAGIEARCFPLPWTQEMFARELAQSETAPMLVARVRGAAAPFPVAGYICLWVVCDELHINNLAVDPAWRRRGIAEALLEAGLALGRSRRLARATLEVRMSNLAALALYQRHDFLPVGIRRGYYAQPVEDAVIMTREGI